MHQCVLYTAKSYKPFDRDTLAHILGVARMRNEMTGVTGILLYGRSTVMQYLEGPQAEVERTLARIKRDTRVYDVRVEVSRAIASRSFPGWSMAYDHAAASEVLGDTKDLRSPDALPDADGRFSLVLTMLRNFRDGVALRKAPHLGRNAARVAHTSG